MPAYQRLRPENDRSSEQRRNSRDSQTKISRSAMRNLRLGGADRFSPSSCWRRNANSASRAACNLNNPTANPPNSFKRSTIPAEEPIAASAPPRKRLLVGADRLKTRSWWRRNTISASRPACDLNSPTSHPPSSLTRSIIPGTLPHCCACASPDQIFGRHRQHQRTAAEHAVQKLTGVREVINQVRVRARPQATDIRHRIEEAFRRDANLEAARITVTVVDGQVELGGSVQNWHERDAAERAAWSAPGVSSVRDHIAIL